MLLELDELPVYHLILKIFILRVVQVSANVLQGMAVDSFTISNQPTGQRPFQRDSSIVIEQLGLKNGDLLYVNYLESGKKLLESSQISSLSSSSKEAPVSEPLDAIDEKLLRLDGLIKRPPSTFCRHGPKGMCDYCSPLEPFDAQYMQENQVKHISFHAHLRQLHKQELKKGVTDTKNIPVLEDPSFSVCVPCPGGQHAPYPASMCAKCQPSAIVLQQQVGKLSKH